MKKEFKNYRLLVTSLIILIFFILTIVRNQKMKNIPINPEETNPITMRKSSSYIIPADFPDPDIIRVDDTYYMVSTTMHFMPGCVILRSHNLVDWEHAAYVYDELESTEKETLADNKGAYGKGMWAACIRHHKGKFYISFVANDTGKTYLFTSEKIEGPWQRSEIKGFYHGKYYRNQEKF